MTRTDLRNLMRYWLDDLQGTYFTDVQCNSWLNNAQQQVQQKLLQAGQNWYQTLAETNTVINQYDYLLPQDFMVEHRIELILSGYGTTNEVRLPLKMITTNQQDLTTVTATTPNFYFIKKDRITVLGAPQQVWPLRLYYSPRIVDMTSDSDSPDVPIQFHEFVAILAAYDGFIKDDRAPDNLVAKKMTYEELLKQMAATRIQDHSRDVVTSSDWGDGSTGYW